MYHPNLSLDIRFLLITIFIHLPFRFIWQTPGILLVLKQIYRSTSQVL